MSAAPVATASSTQAIVPGPPPPGRTTVSWMIVGDAVDRAWGPAVSIGLALAVTARTRRMAVIAPSAQMPWMDRWVRRWARMWRPPGLRAPALACGHGVDATDGQGGG